jgi:DNA-nicking Smr family endonuclease
MIDFGGEVDLHYFHPRDTELLVNEFIRQAIEKGLTNGRIIHGKGRSQKKLHVHEILSSCVSINSFSDDGSNWGATNVEFSPLKDHNG